MTNTVSNQSLLSNIKVFLLDMDGTLCLGDKVIDGAVDAVKELRTRAKVCFLTNNSSKSVNEYLTKLNKMGFMAGPDEIISSQTAATAYLNKAYPGKSLYILGTPSLKADFEAAGFTLKDEGAEVAVLGYDTTLSYNGLTAFCHKVRSGIPYVATHPDLNCPSPDGMLPDTGSFIELIHASTGRRPDIICGKPFKPMTDFIISKFDFAPSAFAMVGDRMTTDIAFAQANGFVSVLVLTGETTVSGLEEGIRDGRFVMPDIVAKNIGEL